MLPKGERLSKEKDIKRALEEKEFVRHTPLLYLTARSNSLKHSRLLVITSKKIGTAVVRNRIKRNIVGAYSKIKYQISRYYDIVVFPKKNIAGRRQQEIVVSLQRAMQDAGILNGCQESAR